MGQLTTTSLLAIVGPSGVGKSSFVHAGLVPALRAAGDSWHVQILRPGRTPVQRLAAALEAIATPATRSPEFAAQLEEAPGFFGVMIRAAAARTKQRVLVVVDQLEELFTLCANDRERAVFLAALLSAADDPSSPVRVVLSMRADFLDRLATHPQFLAEVSRGLFFLSAPDEASMRETLLRPAELAGYSFEHPDIVEDMMRAATSRGALPLLSFAALRLWEGRDVQRRLLTRQAYDSMGGVGGAFAQHADQVAAAIPPQQHRILRAVITRLVTVDGTRAVVDKDELLTLSTAPGDVEPILDHLAHARLINVYADPQRGPTIELVHETLIGEWPLLRRWLEESHAARGTLDDLQRAARQWDAQARSPDLLWRGAPASEALARIDGQVADLSAVERAFVTAVRGLATRGRRRRVLVLASIASLLALVFIGGTIAVIRISLAERDAQSAAERAVAALDEAQRARADLQEQLDVIAAAERARIQAEQREREEQARRTAAERDLATAQVSGVLTREQLEIANQQLARKVAEAQTAKEKAQSAEAAARVATESARAANAKTEQLLARERVAREKAEAELKKIDQRRLE